LGHNSAAASIKVKCTTSKLHSQPADQKQ